MRKIFIVTIILVLIFFINTSCRLANTETGEEEASEGVGSGNAAADGKAEEEAIEEEELKNENYYIAYFEVDSDESSMHFEHRVANILAVSPDGSDKGTIYTDLKEKYDLSKIYGISPDSTKISCGFYEGGRGAYAALSVIDILTGELDTVVKFDYTETESMELMADVYGRPIWSHSGENIAYETVNNPYTDNFSDGGISVVDTNTLDIQPVNVNMEGLFSEDEAFLNPVFFSGDDSRLFNVLHTLHPKMEEGDVLGYFTRNEKLVAADVSSGEASEILDISQLEGMEASFDNFSLFTSQDKIVFQVLGDFEEDGDIWICDIDGSNLSKLTSDPGFREQQPSILDIPDSAGRVAYVSVDRYGTIPFQFNGGDIYIINIDGSGEPENIEYELDAAKPIFSPNGRYVAFVGYKYDSGMGYIESRRIAVYDMESGEVKVIASGSGIFDLIGWVKVDVK